MANTTLYKDYSEASREPQYKIIDNQIKKIVPINVHEYSLLDNYWTNTSMPVGVSGTDYMLKEWIQSEPGQWVIRRTVRTPELIKGYHQDTYEIMIRVVAYLYEEDAIMFILKWK